ncbi:MAG: class GN sortase [Marinobacterium sp.]
MRRRLIQAGLAAICVAGLGLIGQALWIPAKAQVAQWLLADAWERSVQSGEAVKPWPWADHWPVARLHMDEMDIDQIVLAGDTGSVLAFGPGENMQAKALEFGARIISGHRDTHFAFLRDVAVGQTLSLADGRAQTRYRIESIQVVDSAKVRLRPESYPDGLMLVTCYPFDALRAGGTQRLVVMASPVDKSSVL